MTTEDNGFNTRITRLEQKMVRLEEWNVQLKRQYVEAISRIYWLEKAQPDSRIQSANLKSQAAQTEATQNLYAPLRNDTKAVLDLAAFARRLLDPHDLAYEVSIEVRQCARRALGLPEATINETVRNR
jgi:hypothetical protein